MSAKISPQAFSWIVGLVAIVVLLSASSLLYAQGCAMCYTSAAASKAGALHALRSGILILLLPVLVMCSGISVVIYRSRDRFLGVTEWTPVEEREARELFALMNEVASQEQLINKVPSRAAGSSEGRPCDETPGGNEPPATDKGRPQVQL